MTLREWLQLWRAGKTDDVTPWLQATDDERADAAQHYEEDSRGPGEVAHNSSC